MSIRFLLLLLAELFILSTSVAQAKYLSENYWVEKYGKEHGLPEDVVIEVMQDRKGYLWMITPYHLVRYDGYEFKVFYPLKEFPGLNIHFGIGLQEDAQGKIWIPTRNTGLLCFDPQSQKFSRFFNNENLDLAHHTFNDLIEDKNANIWAARYDGLYRYSRTKTKNAFQSLNPYCPTKLMKAIDNVIAYNPALLGFTKVQNSELRSDTIEIKKTSRILLICMGEIEEELLDYGWIENMNGKAIWKFENSKTFFFPRGRQQAL